MGYFISELEQCSFNARPTLDLYPFSASVIVLSETNPLWLSLQNDRALLINIW